jgi:hypothetical protein
MRTKLEKPDETVSKHKVAQVFPSDMADERAISRTENT